MTEWVVIATVHSVFRAQMVVAHLKAEGIAARIEFEIMSSLFPSFGSFQESVEIKVPWQEARSAYELLETYLTDEGDRLFL